MQKEQIKRDTLWLLAAVAVFALSLAIHLCTRDSADYPDRHFPEGGYEETEKNFGMRLSPPVISYAKRVVDNVRRITESRDKDRFLYKELYTRISKRYNRDKIASLFGFLDEDQEGWLLGVFLQAVALVRRQLPADTYLPDPFLFAALNNEGRLFADYSDFGKIYDLNGYANAGLDWFTREFRDLRRMRYLPASFKNRFYPSSRTNELGELVPTADFYDAASLFMAFTAVIAKRQLEFKRHCRQLGIDVTTLDPEALLFYAYLYYNAGQGFGRRLVFRLGTGAALEKYMYSGPGHVARGNAVTVMTAYEWLYTAGAFEREPQGRYWWSGGTGLPTDE